MAVGDDKLSDFTVDNYTALELKHPQREIALFRTKLGRSSSTRLPCPSPTTIVQVWMALQPKIWQIWLPGGTGKRANGAEISPSLNNSCKCDSRRKCIFRTSTVLPWCEIKCAKTTRWRISTYRCRQCYQPLSAKCAGYHVFESRQARYGSRQIGVCTKRGAELASQVVRCLNESPSPTKYWLWILTLKPLSVR